MQRFFVLNIYFLLRHNIFSTMLYVLDVYPKPSDGSPRNGSYEDIPSHLPLNRAQSTLDFVGTKLHIPNMPTSSATSNGIKLCTPFAGANNPAANGINAAPSDPTITPTLSTRSHTKSNNKPNHTNM